MSSKSDESDSVSPATVVAIIQLLFFILVLVRGCEANEACKQVQCPEGLTPDATGTVFGLGLDYQCTCGKDM